jgi:rhodanese-related sulfurtransferase
MSSVRALLKQGSILLVAAMLPAWATASFRWSWRLPPEIQSLPLSEVRQAPNPILWVDVRDPERFQAAHIPEALYFDELNPQGALPNLLQRWTPRSKVLVYGEGQGSDRALRVAKTLKKILASSEVFLLEGGWLAWPKP